MCPSSGWLQRWGKQAQKTALPKVYKNVTLGAGVKRLSLSRGDISDIDFPTLLGEVSTCPGPLSLSYLLKAK